MATINANSAAATNLTAKQWDSKFFNEYVQANRFAKYFGTSENAMIQVKEDLTKSKGDAIHYALVNRLTGTRNDGSAKLEGAEETLLSRAHRLTVGVIRHAVSITDWDNQKSSIDLRDAAKSAIKVWSMEQMRNDIISALHEVKTAIGTKVVYGSATEAQRDKWLDDNVDRIIYIGHPAATDAPAGGATYDHSATLTDITSSDTLTATQVSLAKRKALLASPKISPITVDGDEQWYVMFVHPYSMRDLKADSAFLAANRDARERGKGNPLFTDSDYIYDGVIIREVADLSYLSNVGAGGTVDVTVNFLCGAQALGLGWAQRTKSTTQVNDYGYEHGVGIQEFRAVDKLCFEKGAADSGDWCQNGVVTVYAAASADV